VSSESAARVSLLRWLRRQLRQPIAVRERLEAAVENDDPAEVRRLLATWVDFSEPQRRYVEQLLEAWESARLNRLSRQQPENVVESPSENNSRRR
jgi:hypothetical protein